MDSPAVLIAPIFSVGVPMAHVIVYDRCVLAARDTCLRLRRRHRLEADVVHPTDFDLTFNDGPPPALIVTELQMPMFSGFELIRRVRSAHKASQVPIIAYTAIDDALAWEQARELGANQVVYRLGGDPLARLDAAVEKLLRKPVAVPAARPQGRLLRFFLPSRATAIPA